MIHNKASKESTLINDCILFQIFNDVIVTGLDDHVFTFNSLTFFLLKLRMRNTFVFPEFRSVI